MWLERKLCSNCTLGHPIKMPASCQGINVVVVTAGAANLYYSYLPRQVFNRHNTATYWHPPACDTHDVRVFALLSSSVSIFRIVVELLHSVQNDRLSTQ